MTASLRVLLVEPAAMSRLVATRLLERLGCRVEAVGTAPEAIGLARDRPYDLCLVADEHPAAAVTTIARAVREAGAVTPVVAMVDRLEENHRREWQAAGVAACLAKPLRGEQLQSLLAGLGDARGSAAVPARPPAPPGLSADEMLETRFPGDAAFYAEMLDVFVRTSREPLERMRRALQSAAWGDLSAAAHFVKGGALNVGAEGAAAEARAVEDSARSAPASGGVAAADVEARLAALEGHLGSIRDYGETLAAWASARGAPA